MNMLHQFATSRGFVERYLRNLVTSANQREAYEATEHEYISLFNRRRFANYESFRKVKSALLNGRRK